MPERVVAEALVEALDGVPVHARALIARAAEAPRRAARRAARARSRGRRARPLRDGAPSRSDDDALAAPGAPTTSRSRRSSTVRFLLDAARRRSARRRAARLDRPRTSATLREHGLEPDVEATEHDVDGLVGALLSYSAR